MNSWTSKDNQNQNSGEESDDNITTYQKHPTKPSQHKEEKKTGIKRKVGNEIPTTMETKVKKTEESIKK